MQKRIGILMLVFCANTIQAQSFEVLTGTKRLFLDLQYLEFFDADHRWSLFARSRATAEYANTQMDVFSGGYLNYTSKSGLGWTVLGRISSTASGLDTGIHFFKANPNYMVYALGSINLNRELLYSWFSIFRYTPQLSEHWRLFTSLELFSAFGTTGHLTSVQRIRLGLQSRGIQFGLGVNLGQSPFGEDNFNPGLFVRKQF